DRRQQLIPANSTRCNMLDLIETGIMQHVGQRRCRLVERLGMPAVDRRLPELHTQPTESARRLGDVKRCYVELVPARDEGFEQVAVGAQVSHARPQFPAKKNAHGAKTEERGERRQASPTGIPLTTNLGTSAHQGSGCSAHRGFGDLGSPRIWMFAPPTSACRYMKGRDRL